MVQWLNSAISLLSRTIPDNFQRASNRGRFCPWKRCVGNALASDLGHPVDERKFTGTSVRALGSGLDPILGAFPDPSLGEL